MSSAFWSRIGELLLNTSQFGNTAVVSVLGYVHASFFLSTRRPFHFWISLGWLANIPYLALEAQPGRGASFVFGVATAGAFLFGALDLIERKISRLMTIAALLAFYGLCLGPFFLLNKELSLAIPAEPSIAQLLPGAMMNLGLFIWLGMLLLRLQTHTSWKLFQKSTSENWYFWPGTLRLPHRQAGSEESFNHLTFSGEEPLGERGEDGGAKVASLSIGTIQSDAVRKEEILPNPRKKVESETGSNGGGAAASVVDTTGTLVLLEARDAVARKGRSVAGVSFILFGVLQLAYPFHGHFSVASSQLRLDMLPFLLAAGLKFGTFLGFRQLISAHGRDEEIRLRRAEIASELLKITATVEHDMRSPLHELEVLSEDLRKEAANAFSRRDRLLGSYLKKKARGVEGTHARSKAILDLVLLLRLGTRKIDISGISSNVGAGINRAIHDCKLMFSNPSPSIKIFGVSDKVNVATTGPRLAVLIRNLLVNSIESCLEVDEARRPLVEIRCDSVVGEDGRAFVEISICDKGKGVDPQMLPFVTRAYVTSKAQGEEKSDKNRGLGLFVVDRVTRMHHGYFKIHSEPLVQTRAVIGLPRV